MIAHKCDGCRYKGEHVEMGFKPFGVCYKETNLIEAEKAYKADVCPYKQNEDREIKTPYDAIISKVERELRGEEKPVYFPQQYKIKGEFAEIEPVYLPQLYEIDPEPLPEIEQWPIQNPYITAEIGCALETLAKATIVLAETIENLTKALPPILKMCETVIHNIIDLYPDKRVIYLATHGKRRTRKKNKNRIIKWYERLGRNAT